MRTDSAYMQIKSNGVKYRSIGGKVQRLVIKVVLHHNSISCQVHQHARTAGMNCLTYMEANTAMRERDVLHLLPEMTSKAVAHYWSTRGSQTTRQQGSGASDQGQRCAVTGGAQMDGFIKLFTSLVTGTGIPERCVHTKGRVALPGYFRPTKEWDLLVVIGHTLVAAIEAKSQAGPSFGNNFNNRTEEALGSALDLWTAFRERAFHDSPCPFLGYVFLLEDCDRSNSPVRVQEPHFSVFPEFVDASYRRRYELFCRKLVLERHYTAAALITSSEEHGRHGEYVVPASDLSMDRLARSFVSHLGAFA